MDATVTVRGRSDFVLPAGFQGNDQFSLTSRRLQLDPLMGEPVQGRWVGVPVSRLLDAADVPEQATHLLLEGANGYQAPVPMNQAIDGLVTFERRDEVGMTPRFLASGLDIRQCVCQLTSIEWLVIEERIDPTTLATW